MLHTTVLQEHYTAYDNSFVGTLHCIWQQYHVLHVHQYPPRKELASSIAEKALQWECGSARCAGWRDEAAADTRGMPEKSEHKHTGVTIMPGKTL